MPATKHAKKRIKERCGIQRRSADRVADIVLRKGLTREELRGNLRKYVDGVYFNSPSENELHDNQFRVYGEKIYVFSNTGFLITMFALPQQLAKLANTIYKQKEQKQQNLK